MTSATAVADPPPGRLAAAFAMAVLSAVIFGATPAATAFAVAGLDGILVGFLRTILAVPLVFVIIVVGRLAPPGNAQEWGLLAVSCLAGFVGFTLLFTVGVAKTSTAHAGLILGAIPLTTGMAEAVLTRKLPSRLWFVGAATAIFGEALLIFGRQGHVGEATLGGDLLVVVATISAAVGYMAGSRLSSRIGTWQTTTWGIVLASALMLPFLVWLSTGTDWMAVPASAWGGLAYMAILTTVVAYAAWYWAMAAGGIVRVAPVQYLQPLVALVLAVLIFSEAMTPTLLVAAALILTGVALARKG